MRTKRSIPMVLMLIAATGCGEDGPTSSADPYDEAHVRALLASPSGGFTTSDEAACFGEQYCATEGAEVHEISSDGTVTEPEDATAYHMVLRWLRSTPSTQPSL